MLPIAALPQKIDQTGLPLSRKIRGWIKSVGVIFNGNWS
ncbi:hypothetical protein PL9631_850057 [Planktothrix paucivesiculata PCC 9631]|uniref:Uncharacterized protein n=1 Tax=Planktothrix paucivesiculata PCC 9631 TaxID=671071 RepID=A0A7Z9C0F2_9CYAN|nr:hypothetical protein PL9631_850057 [Planktothrix paucivesiculata PCC 9631]